MNVLNTARIRIHAAHFGNGKLNCQSYENHNIIRKVVNI